MNLTDNEGKLLADRTANVSYSMHILKLAYHNFCTTQCEAIFYYSLSSGIKYTIN